MAHLPAERCLAIIELLADGARAMPLGEIAERLALPKSGAHRLLGTLVDIGWAAQEPDTGFYRLSMRLAILGQQFYVATGIPDLCQPILEGLARESREFVRLAVIDGHALVWVAQAQGASGGLMYQPTLTSNTVPLFATASGKAWLATLSPEEAMPILMKNGGLHPAGQWGPSAVKTIDAFLRELKATVQRGFGTAVNEAEFGVTAVAAPIRGRASGPVLGTISIAGPSARIDARRMNTLGAMVQRAAHELATLWPLRAARSVREDVGDVARAKVPVASA